MRVVNIELDSKGDSFVQPSNNGTLAVLFLTELAGEAVEPRLKRFINW